MKKGEQTQFKFLETNLTGVCVKEEKSSRTTWDLNTNNLLDHHAFTGDKVVKKNNSFKKVTGYTYGEFNKWRSTEGREKRLPVLVNFSYYKKGHFSNFIT